MTNNTKNSRKPHLHNEELGLGIKMSVEFTITIFPIYGFALIIYNR